MKINVVLLGFILISFSVFKAAIIPNTATIALEGALTPPTIDYNGLSEAFAKTGQACTEGGFFSFLTNAGSCLGAIANALVKLFYFIGQLFIAIFWLIVDILLLAILFLQIGFSPIPTAPLIVNLIIVGTFSIMLLVAVISFFPGEN